MFIVFFIKVSTQNLHWFKRKKMIFYAGAHGCAGAFGFSFPNSFWFEHFTAILDLKYLYLDVKSSYLHVYLVPTHLLIFRKKSHLHVYLVYTFIQYQGVHTLWNKGFFKFNLNICLFHPVGLTWLIWLLKKSFQLDFAMWMLLYMLKILSNQTRIHDSSTWS